MDYSAYPSPCVTHDQLDLSAAELEVSDYLLREALDELSMASSEKAVDDGSGSGSTSVLGGSTSVTSRNNNIKCKNGMKKKKEEEHIRFAFRTKSDIETMDDGFKWRKYGKKSVKNSPNPRNYYRCSSGGCQVKKRVERDGEDSSYVITTYEGVHNHESPCVVYYNHNKLPLLHNAYWTFQPSNNSLYSLSP